MPMSSIPGSLPQHPTPQTYPEGELRESITVKAKEAEALVLQARLIMVNAVDIKA
jgi:hypothetical protein